MSKKSGPLNKAEKFYLDNHDSSVKEFALDLNRSEKVIKEYLESTEKFKDSDDHNVGNLMGRKTASQGREGVAIMTPAASELSDAVKPKQTTPIDISGHVWKIKNDE